MKWASSLPHSIKQTPTTTPGICRLSISRENYGPINKTLQKGQYHINFAYPSKKGRCIYVTRNALPDATAAVMTVVAVGAAATILVRQTKSKSSESTQRLCEACNGSGICSECNGEGFLLKKLSKEASDRARKNAKDAATRYTAGLPKKWNYCSKCSGSRGCLVCDGRGMIQ